jgi:hypothetical protein
MINPTSRSILAVALAVIATVGLAACSGATPQPQGPSADPSASAPPAASSDPGSNAGGGSAGDPGTGAGSDQPQGPLPVDPIVGQAQIVQPLPGRANPHPVAPIKLEASVDGRHVLVKVTWYGGVDPCSVLDSVKVSRSGNDIAITLFEGASNVNVACIDIALLKATIVDLGEPDPGTWRISSPGNDAPPIEVTIT